MIPNAEYAPLIALTPEGHRAPTDAEAAAWHAAREQAEADHGEPCTPMIMVGEALVRRLRCDDELDQRAIWALAALALFAPVEEAFVVTVQYNGGALLDLCSGGTLLRRWSGTPDRMPEATAALCAHVWGPK